MNHCECGEKGVYRDPYHPYSKDYCTNCFSTYLEKKLIQGFPRKIRGRSVAVAVSGGKDSMALLHLLASNQKKLRISRISALMLEEGIPSVKEEREEILNYITRNYPNVTLLYEKYEELFSYTIPELIELSDSKETGFTPCMICGILRRQALFQIGLRHNIHYLAMGTTLEDEATTVLINIIRGNPSRNIISDEKSKKFLSFGFPARISPFSKISEDLISHYIEVNEIPILKSHCPYSHRSLRSVVSEFVTVLKQRDSRGSLLFNLRQQKNLSEPLSEQEVQLIRCQICDFPSNQSHCPSCKILLKLTAK